MAEPAAISRPWPAQVTYHYHLGVAYQKNNDHAHAEEQLERALQLNQPRSQAEEIRQALAGNSSA